MTGRWFITKRELDQQAVIMFQYGSIPSTAALNDLLANNLPPCDLTAAWQGDPDAAETLVYEAANCLRGIIAVAAYRDRIPVEALRAILDAVWEHEHRHLIEACGNDKRKVRRLFARAKFDVSHLPDPIPLWRGTSYVSLKRAAAGLSWTTKRDRACWFAMRFAEQNGRPLVLSTIITRKDVLYWSDVRNEGDTITRYAPSASCWGSPKDWQEGYDRQVEADKRYHDLLMAKHAF